jgi:hypothetical protein
MKLLVFFISYQLRTMKISETWHEEKVLSVVAIPRLIQRDLRGVWGI